jgi:two-component system sensor histidine kinase RegB
LHAPAVPALWQIAAPDRQGATGYACAVSEVNAGIARADSEQLGLRWFTTVRWITVIAGAGAVFAGRNVLQAPAPIAPAIAALIVFAISNVWLTWRARRATTHDAQLIAPLLMCADVALLSWLLLRAGGVLNPASVFYLVEIVVAALVFGRRWTWIVAVLAVAGYAASFLAPTDDLRSAQMMHPEIALHMRGMWLAFALTAVIIAALVTRLLSGLERRDRALDVLRVRNEGAMRAASLATLAAGAAHELSTPLATIAVAARELERGLSDSSNEGRHDARLIRDEAARCRAILDDLSGAAGQPSGEPPQFTSLTRVLDDMKTRLPSTDRDRVRIADAADADVQWPIRPVARALANVIQNALQASSRDVRIAVTQSPGSLTIVVADEGPGMTPEQAARAGDPFYTTKPGGTGLGLFVTRSTIEQLGGTFRLATQPDAGTTVTMTLPIRVGR